MIFKPRACPGWLVLALALLGVSPSALAQLPQSPQFQYDPRLTTVELTADASRTAANDLAIATVFVEASDASPAVLSQRVNAAIGEALDLIRAYPSVKANSAGATTFPVYGKNDRKVEAWRMRADIRLETRDLAALSELLGKLQTKLALGGLMLQPSPETRRSVADLATTDAIRAFQARAKNVADTLGKAYRIRHLTIMHGDRPGPIRPMMKSAAFDAESVPFPVEAGESELTVTINGIVELSD